MKKYIKKISILIIIILISLTAIFYVKADSGWDSDYGGGSDWGGSSWSSSDYGSDYSGSGGSGVASIAIFVLVIIFLVLYFTIFYNRNKQNTNSSIINYYPDLSDEEYNKYFGMSKGKFKNKIKNNFISVQESWMNFNYENLRKLCTDELYNQYKTLLETLKLKNEQNIMSDFLVNNISVYKVEQVNDIVEVKVLLDIKFKDYVINTINNNVIRGNRNIVFNNIYELTFVSSKNSKLTNCPSCGAPLEVISSNKCEYCKNTIVQISDELVLSKKKIILSKK